MKPIEIIAEKIDQNESSYSFKLNSNLNLT